MNLLKSIADALWSRRDQSFGTSDPRLLELFGSAPAAAGVSVTPATAMRSTPVRCAVQAIAEAIGSLPLHVYQRQADGARDRASTHPAYAVLHDEPNAWTSAADFWEQFVRDALLHGNAFAHIGRAGDQLRELVRIAPEAVSVERQESTGEPLYRLSDGRAHRYLDRRDVLHLKAPSLDGMAGRSPIVEAKEAIALALVMERHAAKLFGNSARPSGVLKFTGKLGGDVAARIKASWQQAHGGDNAGGTAVLEEGGEFQSITLNSVDAQFLELWQHTIAEIARIFRVPPILLMEYGRATWANSEEMGRQFVTYTLLRWTRQIQGEIRLKVFTEEERARFFAEFSFDGLLQADIGKRADAYAKLIAARVLNPNEARAMENRPPYDGGDAFLNPNTTAGGGETPPPSEGGDE